MKIVKFGGSSVSNAENILRCIQIIKDKSINDSILVVVSAFGDMTDYLLDAAKSASVKDEKYLQVFSQIENHHIQIVKSLIPTSKQASVLSQVILKLNELEVLLNGCCLLGELSKKTEDLILSYGERLSAYILSEVIKAEGADCHLVDSRDILKTDEHFGKAIVNFTLSNSLIRSFFRENKHKVSIIPGFVAESESKQITTLGRGGSDYTAAIIAAALDMESLEIWTDVSGIYTADPKLVKQARTIKSLSFQEAMELSHFGAKVLYSPTLQPILAKNIPLYVKNTFEPEAAGTIIHHTIPRINGNAVRGISNIDHVALITLEGPGMVGVTGFSERLFEVFSKAEINIIFITQASSEYSICFAIEEVEAERAEKKINEEFHLEITEQKIKPALIEKDLSIIAVVGENMKNHQGISGKMFSALGRNNINIRAIAQGASERNISTIIAQKNVRKALNTLHEAFFEEDVVQLNLFIMGVGNVGSRFLEQIDKQREYLFKYLKLNVRVIGLANSRTMFFNEEGIVHNQWKESLNAGEKCSLDGFIERIRQLNLRNSVFVDMTASEEVARSYASYLYNSIGVVTCNKIACASDYDFYKRLKDLSRKYHAPFLFETSVGAGLPVIDTLKNLIASGDRIHKIEAVLSGSLNFIFNHFDDTTSFDEAVEMAQAAGYTEPNPLIDLSGIDVQRKLMILVRESGYKIEFHEVENGGFLPESCLKAKSTKELYQLLKENRSHFDALYYAASKVGGKLKFVASFEQGVARVGLQIIPSDHDFYHLEGKDNIILFYTDRYCEQPLVVKGAGAGASVTASGIFADVIRIGNKNI